MSATRRVLIYDGDCGFCTQSAKFLEARFTPGSTIAPWHALDLDALGLTIDDVTTAAYWVDDAGRTHRGSEGIALALTRTRAPWSLAGWAMRVPPVSWLAAAVYPVVAKNRHKLPGATDACAIPSAPAQEPAASDA